MTKLYFIDRPRSIKADGREADRGIGITAELGEEKIILVNVSSYPPPNKVSWTIDGKTIDEGRSNERYEAVYKRNLGHNMYEVALKIKNLDEEDLAKKIELKVINDLGSAEYVININSTDDGSGNSKI